MSDVELQQLKRSLLANPGDVELMQRYIATLERVVGDRPMTKGEFLNILATRSHQFAPKAKEHLQLNSHMHDLTPDQITCSITDDQVRAILNGFVNFVGAEYGVDYAMNTSDFPRE